MTFWQHCMASPRYSEANVDLQLEHANSLTLMLVCLLEWALLLTSCWMAVIQGACRTKQ